MLKSHPRTGQPKALLLHVQVGGLGVKDYAGRDPSQEQLEDVVCKSDPNPGFSLVVDNFAELLEDSFLRNLTNKICKGTSQLHTCKRSVSALVI